MKLADAGGGAFDVVAEPLVFLPESGAGQDEDVPAKSLSPLPSRPGVQDDDAGGQIEETVIRSGNCCTVKVTA